MVSLPNPEIKLQNAQKQWHGVNATLFLKWLDFQKESTFELLSVYVAQSKTEKKSLKRKYYLKYKFSGLPGEYNVYFNF